MKAIGGYFGLELNNGYHHYHDTPYALKSGRASLHYILNFVKPELVYIPYYTCDGLLEPFETTGTNYRFYEINENLEPENLIELNRGEYFLYVNYMDLKRDTVTLLSEKYKDKLIADCTQAFFMKGNGVSWFFNSCRKYFGVPDGSYLYHPAGIQLPPMPVVRNEEYIVDHLLKRFNGHVNDGYSFFLQNEVLAGRNLSPMSLLSEYLLSQLNYTEIAKKRWENYDFLHTHLKSINIFPVNEIRDAVPMHYPLVLAQNINRTKLFIEDIFIPTFWKDTLQRDIDGFMASKELSENMLPLPIDHRYDTADMQRVVHALQDVINNG